MKKILLTSFLLLFVGVITPSLAQQRRTTPTYKRTERTRTSTLTTETPNLIKINPLSMFVRTASLSYERVLSDYTSIQLGVQYTIPRKARIFGQDILGENGQLNRFSITPEFRYFPNGAAPTGFYIAPFLRYAHSSISGDIEKTINGELMKVAGKISQNVYSLGGVVGGQWIVGSNLSMEAYIGPYFSASNLTTSSNLAEEDYKIPVSASLPFWIRTGFTIGYTF